MNKLIALVLCAGACAGLSLADTEAVSLKARIKENGNVLVLGVDNVEREAVMITPTEYASLTNAMLYLSGLREYREKIHGKIVSRVADAETKVVVYRYSDGFVWSEPMSRFNGRPANPKRDVRAVVKGSETKPYAMSDAQWQALKAKRDAKKLRSVNVTYGPGGKVLGVEQ